MINHAMQKEIDEMIGRLRYGAVPRDDREERMFTILGRLLDQDRKPANDNAHAMG